jgi:hypothetical protein
LQNKLTKAIAGYEKPKERFDADTSKTVKVFNETLGISARMLIKHFLEDVRFKTARCF